MKFNVSSKALYSATSAVSKVINSKNALSILDNFHIKIEGNTLTITGSDQENALTARLEVTGVRAKARSASEHVVLSNSSKSSPTRAWK